jgi:hypothetical protein
MDILRWIYADSDRHRQPRYENCWRAADIDESRFKVIECRFDNPAAASTSRSSEHAPAELCGSGRKSRHLACHWMRFSSFKDLRSVNGL